MRRGVGLLWLVVACAAPTPARTPAPAPARPTPAAISSASRVVADVHGTPALEGIIPLAEPPAIPYKVIPIDNDDLRWPLARDPELEPHAPLAAIYRSSASWQELCRARGEARGVDPAAALAYLTAWCELPQDRGRARDRLADLAIAPRVSTITLAARADLPDVVVESGLDAIDAMRWLRARRIAIPDVLDALGATYAARGMPDDATSAFQAAESVDPSAAAHCHRELRMRALANRSNTPFEPSDPHDAVCRRVAMYLTCPLVQRPWREAPCADCLNQIDNEIARCPAELLDDPYHRDELRLIALAKHWPVERRPMVWLAFAFAATKVVHVSRGAALVVAALDNAMRTSRCEELELRNIAAVVNLLGKTAVADPPETLAAANALAKLTPATCNNLRAILAKSH